MQLTFVQSPPPQRVLYNYQSNASLHIQGIWTDFAVFGGVNGANKCLPRRALGSWMKLKKTNKTGRVLLFLWVPAAFPPPPRKGWEF